MKTALYWEKSGDKINCLLCPNYCVIAENKAGSCGIRKNIHGRLITTVYGEITAFALDPVEKKPLYHFFPGMNILSIGTNGCNLACQFCQNWEISQNPDSGRQKISVEKVIEEALKTKAVGIAYTYNEPFIWYEFVLDIARKAKEAGLKNVLVTNGYVNGGPLAELLPYIDAMNIDLKAFSPGFYKSICKGDLYAVKDTILTSFEKCHIELTNLLIPGQNDTGEELSAMADWVAGISPDIPFHISRYFPQHLMKTGTTPLECLRKAKKIMEIKLKYVYIGNTNLPENGETLCSNCKKIVVSRSGYCLNEINILKGKCVYCGEKINGIFA